MSTAVPDRGPDCCPDRNPNRNRNLYRNRSPLNLARERTQTTAAGQPPQLSTQQGVSERSTKANVVLDESVDPDVGRVELLRNDGAQATWNAVAQAGIPVDEEAASTQTVH